MNWLGTINTERTALFRWLFETRAEQKIAEQEKTETLWLTGKISLENQILEKCVF